MARLIARSALLSILLVTLVGLLPACAAAPRLNLRPQPAVVPHVAAAPATHETRRCRPLGEADVTAMTEAAALVTRASLDLSLYHSPDAYTDYLAPSLQESVRADALTLASGGEASARVEVLETGDPEFHADDERNVPCADRYVVTVPVRLLSTTVDGQRELTGVQTVMVVLDDGCWHAFRFLGLELN